MPPLQDRFRPENGLPYEDHLHGPTIYSPRQSADDTSGHGIFSAPDFDVLNGAWASEEELAQLLDQSGSDEEEDVFQHSPDTATHELPLTRRRHRKIRRAALRRRLTRTQTLSFVAAALAATIVAMVSVLGGMIAHDPLRNIASADGSAGLADWWPLLVYGPWMVASLSILRAALHQRRAPHSWAVVLLFSAFAILFCIACAPRTITNWTVAALPAIAALSCFHQLVRQITLTRPPRRTPRGRRHS
ncbi:DUF2637 domain-containing protein [Streptomyces sp. NPDC058691]|uniref:DUF2637 domain-containing protein n=1 Tax=Streptomyces sp. NPDC058691 TaxID=3346601 RepID=UPI00364DEEAD